MQTVPAFPTVSTTVGRPDFNDDMPLYHTYCCHVKRWAYFTGVYDMILVVVLGIVALIAPIVGTYKMDTALVVGFVLVAIVAVILLVSLFQGLKNDSANYLLPYLIIYWICIGFQCCGFFVFLIVLVNGQRLESEAVLAIVFYIASLAFRIFLQVILHKTFGYLRDKERHYCSSGMILSRPQVVTVPPAQPYAPPYGYVAPLVPQATTYGSTYPTQTMAGVPPPMPQYSDTAPPAYYDVVKEEK